MHNYTCSSSTCTCNVLYTSMVNISSFSLIIRREWARWVTIILKHVISTVVSNDILLRLSSRGRQWRRRRYTLDSTLFLYSKLEVMFNDWYNLLWFSLLTIKHYSGKQGLYNYTLDCM